MRSQNYHPAKIRAYKVAVGLLQEYEWSQTLSIKIEGKNIYACSIRLIDRMGY